MVEVLHETASHKYLGRYLSGDLDKRAEVEVKHRIQQAWFKFHQHQRVLTNQHISVKLRMKLFDAAISPSLLFGVAALPLYENLVTKIDIVQRKMMRRIVGWTRVADESWEITMRRMGNKVAGALRQWPVKTWSNRIAHTRWDLARRLNSMPIHRWANLCIRWQPTVINDSFLPTKPVRDRGRPHLRWDNTLRKYRAANFGNDWYDVQRSKVKVCSRDLNLTPRSVNGVLL